MDSLCEISIAAEQPINNPIMLNIARPSALRQYDACDIENPFYNIIASI